MGRTSIEWAHFTWQPGIFGCSETSPACAHCYAAVMAHRLAAMGARGYAAGDDEPITVKRSSGVHWSGIVRTLDKPNADALPTRLAVSRLGYRPRVFVTSMADLFHEHVPHGFLVEVFRIMREREDLDFLALTKRADVMADFATVCDGAWPANVWAGVTVEDQKRADERIPHLLRVPARVRFLSMEPLLGPVNLSDLPSEYDGARRPLLRLDALRGGHRCGPGIWGPENELDDPPRLHWVIAGGESGPRARPSHPAWFRDLRDQCQRAGVAFHFKQWGEWGPWDLVRGHGPWKYGHGRFADWVRPWHPKDAEPRWGFGSIVGGTTVAARLGKARAGRELDGRTWDELPVAGATP